MAIDFPGDPTLGDEFTVGNRTWTWNGSGWAISHNALVDVTPFPWPTDFLDAGMSTITANAAGEGTGTIFSIPKTGSLVGGRFRVATVTTGGDVSVRVETVGGTGLNTGSLVAPGADATVVVADSDDNVFKNFTLNTPLPVTQGDLVVVMLTVVALGPVMNFSTTNVSAPNGALPYSINNTSGSFSKDDAYPVLSLNIDGNWVPVPGLWPFNTGTITRTVSSATDPDEIGNLMTMPATMRMQGVQVFLANNSDGDDFQICLYDSDSTLIEAVTIDGGQLQGGGMIHITFAASHVLTGGETYRLTLKATGGALNMHESSLDSATYISLMPGGGNVYATSRTDDGAWTDTNTTFTWILPLIDGISTPAGETL